MKLAVIDMGTNTFHLLIAEVKNGKLDELYKENIAVKLGEGGINKKIIVPTAFQRGLKAISYFDIKLKEFQVDQLKAIGTSALRNAANGRAFAEEVQKIIGQKIEVIDGDREAELIYKGVREAVELKSHRSLIMDIGGGSVEFIICDENEIFWKQSFEIGASRLIQKFQLSDPISKQNIKELEDYFSQVLVPLFIAAEETKIDQIIGSAGSFETFTEMICQHFHHSSLHEKTDFKFVLSEFDHIYQWLMSSTHTDRILNTAIIAMRADMIVVSAVLTNFVLKKIGAKHMLLSTYALKEGVLAEMAIERRDLVNKL
ncbi:Ppx/GppA phosphatase family protein [Solitalea koreensis]|nr:phosphatase [Solitalea koreensis]